MTKPNTVDAFVKAQVLPELRPTVARIRALMREYAPDVTEIISNGMPCYRARRIIAYISPTKKDITLGFSRGAQFQDKDGLLRGVGKSSRHVKLRTAADVNTTSCDTTSNRRWSSTLNEVARGGDSVLHTTSAGF
jgi:hypothetical protein